jgi:hypothetical protein
VGGAGARRLALSKKELRELQAFVVGPGAATNLELCPCEIA